MKKILLLLMFLVLVSSVYAVSSTVTTFTNGLTSEQLNFTSIINITRFITIPNYVYVNNFSISILANLDRASSYVKDASPDQQYIGINWLGGGNNVLDDDTSTSDRASDGTEAWIYINYTIPALVDVNLSKWEVKDQNAQLNITSFSSCKTIGNKLPLAIFSQKTGTRTMQWRCWNGASYSVQLRNSAIPAGEPLMYEESIWWHSYVVHNYSRIYIQDDLALEYKNSPNLKTVNVNVTPLNQILNGCNCQNCTVENNDCIVPVTFYINSTGNLTYSNPILNYSYGIDNCSNSFNIPSNSTSLNISYFDANNVPITVSHSSTITYTGDTFSHTVDANNIKYCIYPSWYNDTIDQQIEYELDGIYYSYFLNDYLYNNITKNLYLYTTNGTTQVLFTVLDVNGDEVQDAYIHILKYDVGTGTYKTTEIIKTDAQGQALGNIVLANAYYTFYIYYGGSLVYTEAAVRLIATTRTFTVNLAGSDWFTNFDTTLGVTTDLYFNDATQNFVYTWSDASGDMYYACLRVDKFNDTGKYNLSNTCTESTSGTILYNIPVLENGTEYIGTGYLKYDNEIITDVVSKIVVAARALFRLAPNIGLFLTIMFCVTMFMIGLPNPALSLAFLGVGVMFTSIFGLFYLSWLQVSTIVVLALIQLYIMGRQNQ